MTLLYCSDRGAGWLCFTYCASCVSPHVFSQNSLSFGEKKKICLEFLRGPLLSNDRWIESRDVHGSFYWMHDLNPLCDCFIYDKYTWSTWVMLRLFIAMETSQWQLESLRKKKETHLSCCWPDKGLLWTSPLATMKCIYCVETQMDANISPVKQWL